jgi:hypothetical protein
MMNVAHTPRNPAPPSFAVAFARFLEMMGAARDARQGARDAILEIERHGEAVGRHELRVAQFEQRIARVDGREADMSKREADVERREQLVAEVEARQGRAQMRIDEWRSRTDGAKKLHVALGFWSQDQADKVTALDAAEGMAARKG